MDDDGAITIGRRYCGPPISGNGGWTAGAVAALLDGPAEVTLRLPPPLDTPMAVERPTPDSVSISGPGGVVAEARLVDPLTVATAPTVSPMDAETAAAAYSDAVGDHPFPTCFVCGPDRSAGDGLRLFTGPITGHDRLVAGPWTPDPSLASADGSIDERAVWAALDCAGGFAHIFSNRPCVLGRMTATVHRLPTIGETYTVIGWGDAPDGRKLPSHTAIVDQHDTSVLAVARSTWIEVDPQAFT